MSVHACDRSLASNAEFRRLYDQHFRFVQCALTRLGTSDVDVMDLTQRVFLIAYLKHPEFEGHSSISAWLWGICRRAANEHRRSGPSRYEVATDPAEFERILERRGAYPPEVDATRQVEHLLAKLSSAQRVVFSLSEMEDLDGVQIAKLLNISVGTVRSRLRCARQRIRREVERLTLADAFELSVAR